MLSCCDSLWARRGGEALWVLNMCNRSYRHAHDRLVRKTRQPNMCPGHHELRSNNSLTLLAYVAMFEPSPGWIMVLFYEVCHILQDVLFFFTCAVWRRPSLALAHAHSSSGWMEPHANLPDEDIITLLSTSKQTCSMNKEHLWFLSLHLRKT